MTDAAGPIALLGSGEFEPWTRDLDRVLLSGATSGDGSVAIVPTASALEGAVFDDWARRGLEHYAALGVPAHVIDLRGPDDAERAGVVEGLARASLIFFSGGNPAYLASTLSGSRFWKTVRERLAEGGRVRRLQRRRVHRGGVRARLRHRVRLGGGLGSRARAPPERVGPPALRRARPASARPARLLPVADPAGRMGPGGR